LLWCSIQLGKVSSLERDCQYRTGFLYRSQDSCPACSRSQASPSFFSRLRGPRMSWRLSELR